MSSPESEQAGNLQQEGKKGKAAGGKKSTFAPRFGGVGNEGVLTDRLVEHREKGKKSPEQGDAVLQGIFSFLTDRGASYQGRKKHGKAQWGEAAPMAA